MDIRDPRVDPASVPPGSRAFVIAERVADYQPLPAVITPNGTVITCWALTIEERRRIVQGEDVFVTLKSYEAPTGERFITPLIVSVGPRDWTGE